MIQEADKPALCVCETNAIDWKELTDGWSEESLECSSQTKERVFTQKILHYIKDYR